MAHHTLRAVVVLALVSSAAITVLAQRTGDQTYFLIAKPDGEIERASTSARLRPTPKIVTPGTPVAHVVATRAGAGNPIDSLLSPSDPQPTTQCLVDFSDYDALNLLTYAPDGWSPYGETTFTFVPWWFQDCQGLGGATVRPIAEEGESLDGLHFHLSYEDPNITACFSFTDWGIMQEDGTCVDFDPREKGRRLSPHDAAHKIEIYLWNGSFKTPFALESLKVMSNSAIRLCYKPLQEDDGEWETAQPGESLPGIWLCWNELGTGNWALGAYASNVTEVRIFSSDNIGVPTVDDVVLGGAH
jgi:hypothetical protein